jgi:hypothetical protein
MPLAAIGGFLASAGGAAAIGAVGTVASAAMASSANKKAVNAQTAAANTNNQLQRDLYESNKNLLNPYVQDGRDASSLLADFIGLSGDGERSNAALDTFLNSTGYQNTVNRGVSAITSNRAAAGALDSGATLKAVSDYGQRTAMSYADRWLNLLSDRVGTGLNAAQAVAGAGQSFVTGTSANNQSAADAASNGAINNANIWGSALGQGVNILGRYAGQSSFPTAKSQTYQAGTLKAQPVSQNETFRPVPFPTFG